MNDSARIIQDLLEGQRILSIERFEDGIEGAVFHVVTKCRSLVFKFLSPSRIKRYPDTVLKQVLLLNYLGSKDIRVPSVTCYSIECNCLSYEYIEGKMIVPSRAHFEKIIRYLLDLSSLDVSNADYLHRFSFSCLLFDLKKVSFYYPSYNDSLQVELNRIKDKEYPMYVSHGNLHIGNILWDNNESPCLIDWDEAMIAPVEWDVSNFFISLAVKSNVEVAFDFLHSLYSGIMIDNQLLSFFIHFNAYNCLIRYSKWGDHLFGVNSIKKNECVIAVLNRLMSIKLI